MNIEKLKAYIEVSNVVANYRKLCEITEVNVVTGNAKIAQLKELERHFDFHKEGNKLVFDKYHEVPKEKNDGRGKSEGSRNNNNAEYVKIIEKLILNLLVQGKLGKINTGKVFLSKNQLLKEFKMINENYTFCKERIHKLSNYMNISKENVEEYYEKTGSMLERNLETALKNLEKQSLVFWSREITVAEAIAVERVDKSRIVKNEVIDCFGEKETVYNYYSNSRIYLKHREGTEDEKKSILYIERKVLDELNCEDKQQLVKNNKWDVFIDKVNSIILKEMNLAYYYKSYSILFNESQIKKATKDKYGEIELSSEDKESHEIQLNKEFFKRNLMNAEKRQERAIDEKTEMDSNEVNMSSYKYDRLIRRVEKNYLIDNANLNKTLISYDSPNIKNDVRKVKLEY